MYIHLCTYGLQRAQCQSSCDSINTLNLSVTLEDIWTLKRASKGGGWRASFALIFVLPEYSTKSNRLHSGKCDDGEEDCDWPG